MHCILGAIAGNGAPFESRGICVYGCFAAIFHIYRVLTYAMGPSRVSLGPDGSFHESMAA
jgi:hypothetical protein